MEHSNYTLNIPLIPTTPEEMEDMFKLCSHVRFKIPQQVRPALEHEGVIHLTFMCTQREHQFERLVVVNTCAVIVQILQGLVDVREPHNMFYQEG